jgi:hypothetical protein
MILLIVKLKIQHGLNKYIKLIFKKELSNARDIEIF